MDIVNPRKSVATIKAPEFLNITSVSPLISKCEIKVLYLNENRNGSYITKEVAMKMAETLPGVPIVGYWSESKEDFLDHGDQIVIDGEGIKFKDCTKPYGFVAPDTKIWFKEFTDTDEFGNEVNREYLMTEGYLWTSQYEECKKALECQNPQSMRLHDGDDEHSLKGHWSENTKTGIEFFIINDATFENLCILGMDVEPCFEGAKVSEPDVSKSFSKDDSFVTTLAQMIKELKEYTLSKGGATLEMENENKQAEEPVVSLEFSAENTESTSDFKQDEKEKPICSEKKDEEEDKKNSEEPTETSSPAAEEPEEEKDKKKPTDSSLSDNNEVESIAVTGPAAYSTEENLVTNIQNDTAENVYEINNSEFAVLQEQFDNLKADYDKLKEDYSALEAKHSELQNSYSSLVEFKEKVEDAEKIKLIDSFYMLSDEDKNDVMENRASYSLSEIKNKLCVICFDKKVNFNNTEENKDNAANVVTTFNLDAPVDDGLPAWLKAVKATKERNI